MGGKTGEGEEMVVHRPNAHLVDHHNNHDSPLTHPIRPDKLPRHISSTVPYRLVSDAIDRCWPGTMDVPVEC